MAMDACARQRRCFLGCLPLIVIAALPIAAWYFAQRLQQNVPAASSAAGVSPVPRLATSQPSPFSTPAAASQVERSLAVSQGTTEYTLRRKAADTKRLRARLKSADKSRTRSMDALNTMAHGSTPSSAIETLSPLPPLDPRDGDSWTPERLHAVCPSTLYNRGWDGYRLADMLQSRYQRHTASGITYHLRMFPESLVANFALNYKKPGQKLASRSHSGRYDAVTNGTCHPGGNLSAFPLSSHSCEKPGWPEHLQCCPYIRPVPALVDILARESTGQNVRLLRTAAVHIRAGEVIDLSPCSVDAMMLHYTRFSRQCNLKGRGPEWTGTGCMAQQAFEYVMPRRHFEWVRDQLAAQQIRRVIIVAGSALNLTVGFEKSCDYLVRVGQFFTKTGFEVAFRLGRPPDDDMRFFARVATFVPAGGSYSRIAGQTAQALGARVLNANRTEPPSIRTVKHRTAGRFVKYIC